MSDDLKKAWVLYEMKKYDSAENVLNNCYDDSREAKNVLAACNFIEAKIADDKRDFTQAGNRYRRASLYAVDGSSVKEDSLFRYSELFLDKKMYYEARTGFQNFVKVYPNSHNFQKAALGLAQSLYATGKPEEALKYFNQSGDSVKALMGKAAILQMLKKYDEARDAYTEALKKDRYYLKYDDKTLYYLAENYFFTGKEKKARDIFNYIKNGNMREQVALRLGQIAVKEKRPEEAMKYLSQAFMSVEQSYKEEALVGMAKLMEENVKENLKKGNLKGAQDSFNDVLRYMSMISKKADKKVLDEVLGHMSLALMDIAREQIGKGDERGANESINNLKKMNLTEAQSKDVDSLIDNLLVKEQENYAREKKYKEAIDMIEKIYAKDHNEKKRLDMIKSVLQEALNAHGTEFPGLWEKYGAHFLEPSNLPLVLNARQGLRGKGKPYEEILLWISKNGSNSDKADALDELVKLYSDGGNKAEAVKMLAQLKSFDVDKDKMLRMEAQVYFKNNDKQTALDKLTMIKKLVAGDLQIIKESLPSVKDSEKALTFYERAINELGGESRDYLKLADAYYELNQKNKATKYYQLLLAKDPGNEWAMYRLTFLLSGDAADEMLKRLGRGNSRFSKYAKIIDLELDVNKKIRERFK
ncbi:MAG: tetratricopeptide repeat protein [Nitrospirae bacterium]|nr:tetratricopeptide repeat protein [Nitrospirota bacterium]